MQRSAFGLREAAGQVRDQYTDARPSNTADVLSYANGALIIVAGAAAGVLLASRPRRIAELLPVGAVSCAAFYLFCGLALAYAFYPNFLDHAEPSIASSGAILLKGWPLYPVLDDYSFRGGLYGPLQGEIQAVALFLGSAIGGLPVILASKLAGVLAFFAASGLIFKVARDWGFSRTYYTLFLIPFIFYAFWNRAEPFLLLLVACSFWAIESCPRRRALLVLGACAGLASALKLHACLYVAPAVVVLASRSRLSAREALLLVGAAAAAFLLLYLPGNVSLISFVGFLLSGFRHGLSWQLLLANLLFACALWCPLFAACAIGRRWRALLGPQPLALAALHLAAAVVGAKAGGGIHHLMPFIPANALIFAGLVDSGHRPETDAERRFALSLVWLVMLLPALVASASFARGMLRDWETYDRARQELVQIRTKYADLVMGVAGESSYSYAYLRPLLEWQGPAQIEYSSYMDQQLVGISDLPLRRAFESCQIKHVAMPKRAPPFTMPTWYPTGTPLFSDELRATFARRFVKVAGGIWYDTYECAPRKD